MTLEEMKKSHDWKNAFEYANNPSHAGIEDKAQPHFTIEDVAVIFAIITCENDENNWIIFGQLQDYRYFFLTAGCDYTGWDCQAWGEACVADELEVLWSLGLGDEDRRRLGGFCPKEIK